MKNNLGDSTERILDSIIQQIADINEVQAIGISGGKKSIPKMGEGDIDIFIYCDTIPDSKTRQLILDPLGSGIQEYKVNVFEGGRWGVGDYVLINGIEIWLMYFTQNETIADIESILQGKQPDKLDNYYYPVGRCAMLSSIHILFDKDDFLRDLKERLSTFPEDLVKILVQYHLYELKDREDLERAVVRKDVLFYHFALDIALDHFLQALFAMNRTFFPSRKRTLEYMDTFRIKPEDCKENLLEVIKLGGFSEGIPQSYKIWSNMVKALQELDRNRKQ